MHTETDSATETHTHQADVTVVSDNRPHEEIHHDWVDFRPQATVIADLCGFSAMHDPRPDTPGLRTKIAETAEMVRGYMPEARPLLVVVHGTGTHSAATAATVLQAVLEGDVQRTSKYGLAEETSKFTDLNLTVNLIHHDHR